jgi:uncharacterized protein (TIGR03435 family)
MSPTVAALVMALVVWSAGQAGSPATFEAASVRASAPRLLSTRTAAEPGGRFTAINANVRMLMGFAFQVRDFQIIGAPGWLTTERFDITATAGRNAPASELRVMLGSLLAERFALRFRRETRQMPIYALTMARANGRPGPQLIASPGDCLQRRMCGLTSSPADGVESTRGGDVRMSQVASFLTLVVRDRMVVDRTGLEGIFNLHLRWTTDDRLTADSPVPSLFTALQEQLGLRLESTSGPVEVLVIDSVGRPTLD